MVKRGFLTILRLMLGEERGKSKGIRRRRGGRCELSKSGGHDMNRNNERSQNGDGADVLRCCCL